MTPNPATLGTLLYRDPERRLVAEAAWLAKVQAIADGDARALHALYERTHRLVFTLAARIARVAAAAEDTTIDVFQEIWKRSSRYNPAKETVLGWIMNLTRARALDRKARAGAPDFDQSTEVAPSPSLWSQITNRIGHASWSTIEAESRLMPRWPEFDWDQPAPGIYCKVLATDSDRSRVSMLVRLDPGVEYPPHRHAGVEELHLLEGELWIDDRKLFAGDYNRAEPGSCDKRVWSETGCACVLITSPDDALN